jgi:hypothetical protein
MCTVIKSDSDVRAIFERQTSVARWLECAEQARAVAATMATPESKAMMLKTAERYERLADQARAAAAKNELGNP